MKHRIVIAALVAALAALGVVHQAHAFTNTCGATSPLLGDAAEYFTFEGTSNGGLYQIEARGVYSSNHPDQDCVWAQTTYTGQGSLQLYEVGQINTALWYSPSPGVWKEQGGENTVYNNNQLNYSVMNNAQQFIDANPPNSGDCIVFNTVEVDTHGNVILDGSLYDGLHAKYSVKAGTLPGINTSLICPHVTS